MKNNKIKVDDWFKANIKYIILFAFVTAIIFVLPFGIGIAQYKNAVDNLAEHVYRKLVEIMELKLFFWFVPPVVISLMEFKYLFSEKKVNFYHSLPLTRKELFINNYITGFLIFLLYQFIIYLLLIIILGCNRCLSLYVFKSIALIFFINIIVFIAIYSICIFVIMLTGNMLISILGMFTFYIYFPLLALCRPSLDVMANFTPVSFLGEGVNAIESIRELYGRHGIHDYWDTLFLFSFIKFLIIAIIVSVIFVILSLILYKYRDLEKAGEPIVFNIAKRIIRIMLASWISIVFCSIFVTFSRRSGALYPIIFSIILALSSHAIMEMIVNKDIKSFYKDIVEKVIAVALAVIVVLMV